MELGIVISSVVLSLTMMLLLSIYWQIKRRIWVPSALVIGLVTAAIVSRIISGGLNLGLALQLVLEGGLIGAIAATAILLWFFRDPERVPPERDGVILSPADGEVIYVRKIEDGSHLVSVKGGRRFPLDELLQTPWPFSGGYLVGISMNLLDVHVNRAPTAGRVALRKRVKGKFLSLRKPNVEVLNERFTTVIDNGSIQVAVVQIASRLVRGIVSYVKEGQQVQIGQRIGMIRFGSQVDLAIPDLEECHIAVKPGHTVRAGISTIARYRQGVAATPARAQEKLTRGAER